MKKLIGLLALVSFNAFAGKTFDQVISYKQQYGTLKDLTVRFEPTPATRNNSFCKMTQRIPTKVFQSGTSGYYSISFTSPNTLLCKYRPVALLGVFSCYKEMGCVKDLYLVNILFSEVGGQDYSTLPDDKTGYEKVLSFPKNDPFTLVQVKLSNSIVNERDLFQFVVVPR